MLSLASTALGQTGQLVHRSARDGYYGREYDGVEFTIEDMRRMVRDALLREQAVPLRKLVEEIISEVPPKDYISEVAAIYYYVLKNVRYVRDPLHVEYVNHPLTLLQPERWDRQAGRRARQDDCEAISTSIAAMCMVIGNACEFCTIATSYGSGFHHVFCVVVPSVGPKLILDPIPGPGVTRMLQSIAKHKFWPVEPVRIPGQMGWSVAGMGNNSLSGSIAIPGDRQYRIWQARQRHAICR